MAEQTGPSVAALKARQAALSGQHSAAVDADRVLVQELAGAHAAAVDGASRLDAITREIDNAIQNQAALAVDTPMGAREFQRFLIAKQRQIIAVVSQLHELDRAKKDVLESLWPQYGGHVR